jgi:hypothetical protein
MNDYLNHNWRKFINEDKKPARRSVLTEGAKKKTKESTVQLPMIVPQISEKWGDPSSVDRQEVEALLSKVARGGTFQSKIDNLNKFILSCQPESKECASLATSTILSRLMALEVLTSIVYDFNASAGGFLFEIFVAALLGSNAQQVIASQSRKEGEAGDIADITHNGKPLSIKFFKGGESGGGSKHIGGSIRDLLGSIAAYGMPIPYLVAVKDTDASGDVNAISFYEFTVGASPTKAAAKGVEIPEGMGGDFDIFSNSSWTKGTKFQIPVSHLTGKRKGKDMGGPLATLAFGSPDDMKATANNYVGQLGEDVTSLYQGMSDLSSNINKYLIRNAPTAGRQAVKDAAAVAYRARKIAPE